ncbi:MAG: fibronectin type III domain-containing protein, partial [Schleiferiaceae bacterium]|nr:fibronectin type III domain-containing protein [Schleiferiaceae bacterium]
MKKLLLSIAIGVFMPMVVFAQITTTSATYTTQSIPTLINFGGPPTTTVNSTCIDTLTVTIPAGDQVVYLDVEYDMTATGAFGFQQYSYMEFFNNGTKEPQVYQGNGFGGTVSYNRTQVNIANGVSASGVLKFGLHAFRTANGVGCDSVFQKVDQGTWKVTVYHGTPPLCLPPSGPMVDWVLSNSAQVSWTSGGAANARIEYGATGFAPGSGTVISATGNSHVITGLTPSTTYDFYIQDSCGVGSTSLWTSVESFTTLCTPET